MANDILVLGGGPKAVALAVKHFALTKNGVSLPNLQIIERSKIAINWDGTSGFTDGHQELVTPPEQDLGFPYSRTSFSSLGLSEAQIRQINEDMIGFSWPAFLATEESHAQEMLEEARPTHLRLTKYLRWAMGKLELKHEPANVVEIDGASKTTWTLKGSSEGQKCVGQALCITGNGRPRVLRGQPTAQSNLISDGETFWKNIGIIDSLEQDARIAVIGSGETAGAIASAILDRCLQTDRQIDLISDLPAYLPRSLLTEDVKYFTDPEFYSWRGLSKAWRRGIIRRADRGVVSIKTKTKLEESQKVRYFYAQNFSIGNVTADVVRIDFDDTFENQEEVDYQLVVVATGFDHLWFLDFFDDESVVRLISSVSAYDPTFEILLRALERKEGPGKKDAVKEQLSKDPYQYLFSNIKQNKLLNQWFVRCLENSIQSDLSVKDFNPTLHLPMFAGLEQGPGFPNLSCLGLLSDRIWRRYAQHATT